MNSLRFKTSPTTATDYISGAGALFDDRVQRAISHGPVSLVADELVLRLHEETLHRFTKGFDCLGVKAVAGGEALKSFDHLQQITRFLMDCGLPKNGSVIAIGGGSICDVVAMAAMLWRRGVGLVLAPTTLLAQIDAAVGGKNGINVHGNKNIVGQFYHPSLVACDQVFLETLDPREQICGVAEAIKVFAVANDQSLVVHAETWSRIRSGRVVNWSDLVWDAIRWKLDLLEADPYERSSRRLLNYGHAFAHLFEERSHFALRHGECVLISMLIENEVSRELGIANDVDSLQMLIGRLVTPECRQHWRSFVDPGDAIKQLQLARRGHMNLVCLVKPGDGRIVDDVSEPQLRAAWGRADVLMAGPENAEAFGSLCP